MTDLLIRPAVAADLDRVAEIEATCFPAAEAAGRETFRARIAAFMESFFVAEQEGRMIGFIDGCETDSPVIFDEMFRGIEHHKPGGANLAIFGLDVIPECRRRGIAARLMEHFIEKARASGRERVILTCKKALVSYYEKFGFVNEGRSASAHGGAIWYDMTLRLKVPARK